MVIDQLKVIFIARVDLDGIAFFGSRLSDGAGDIIGLNAVLLVMDDGEGI